MTKLLLQSKQRNWQLLKWTQNNNPPASPLWRLSWSG